MYCMFTRRCLSPSGARKLEKYYISRSRERNTTLQIALNQCQSLSLVQCTVWTPFCGVWHAFLNLCRPSEVSPWYSAILGGNPSGVSVEFAVGCRDAGFEPRAASLQSNAQYLLIHMAKVGTSMQQQDTNYKIRTNYSIQYSIGKV
jgi:hypothetical protein